MSATDTDHKARVRLLRRLDVEVDVLLMGGAELRRGLKGKHVEFLFG